MYVPFLIFKNRLINSTFWLQKGKKDVLFLLAYLSINLRWKTDWKLNLKIDDLMRVVMIYYGLVVKVKPLLPYHVGGDWLSSVELCAKYVVTAQDIELFAVATSLLNKNSWCECPLSARISFRLATVFAVVKCIMCTITHLISRCAATRSERGEISPPLSDPGGPFSIQTILYFRSSAFHYQNSMKTNNLHSLKSSCWASNG